jgi:dihydropyrimidinase
MVSTGIINGIIVSASDITKADILIKNNVISALGSNVAKDADMLINADGAYIFPGAIDAHTHLDLPFMGTSSSDDFLTGTRAALFGGTTSIIDFAFQTMGQSLKEALKTWHQKARGKAMADYGFHMVVTDFNDNSQQEIEALVTQEGISSFKTFMAYKNALMINDRQMIGLFNEVKKYGALVTVHAENGDLADSLIQQFRNQGLTAPVYHALSRPPIVEAEATGRALDLAYAGQHPLYIVHMTCEEALNRVREATKRNQQVFVETCVQYLLLDDSLYNSPGFLGAQWVMSPPLRTPRDQQALWSGLEQGLIQTVATDHCPFCMSQKELGINDFSRIPNGAPGIEHRLELMFSEGVVKNRIGLTKLVEVCSTNPAKIFGLYPQKGSISIGADADLVIFDPKITHIISARTHHMNCDYSAYENWAVTGKVKTVLLRGNVVINNNQCLSTPGSGNYLFRTTKKFNL